MRVFLYGYSIPMNYKLSAQVGMFGVRDSCNGLASKVQELRPGDIIFIRDTTSRELKFFGHCVVTGATFDQRKRDLSEDLLWSDEIESGQMIYPIRIKADFVNVPPFNLARIEWKDLDALAFSNRKGVPLIGRSRWGQKFVGNFLDARESRVFLEMVARASQ